MSATLPIRALTDFSELDRCVEIQTDVWGYGDSDVVPRRVFVLAVRIGGQVFGAYDGDRIIGFAMALPGYRERHAYLHSHMLAVLPEYRNAGLGRRLKLAQRDDAIVRGFDLMEWTFDPLEIKNSYLNLIRLGAICRRYYPNFYGSSSSLLQGSLPTDRLCAEWWLRSERVERALAGRSSSDPTVERVTVPAEVHAWKADPAEHGRAITLQTGNRLALESAFARGLAITGYERTEDGGAFLLGSLPSVSVQTSADSCATSSSGPASGCPDTKDTM